MTQQIRLGSRIPGSMSALMTYLLDLITMGQSIALYLTTIGGAVDANDFGYLSLADADLPIGENFCNVGSR